MRILPSLLLSIAPVQAITRAPIRRHLLYRFGERPIPRLHFPEIVSLGHRRALERVFLHVVELAVVVVVEADELQAAVHQGARLSVVTGPRKIDDEVARYGGTPVNLTDERPSLESRIGWDVQEVENGGAEIDVAARGVDGARRRPGRGG